MAVKNEGWADVGITKRIGGITLTAFDLIRVVRAVKGGVWVVLDFKLENDQSVFKSVHHTHMVYGECTNLFNHPCPQNAVTCQQC